jgi:hypothetical protein
MAEVEAAALSPEEIEAVRRILKPALKDLAHSLLEFQASN